MSDFALSPLERRNGLSPERMRQRAAANASLIIQARRLGATSVVRKAVAGGQRLMIYDARLNLLGSIDITSMSTALVSEIERACVASPGVYQRQAVENPRPVRKASKKAPVLDLYDKAGSYVAYADPGDVRTVAKAGDIAEYFSSGGEAVFVNPKDIIELATAKPTARRPPSRPAAPVASAEPSPEAVQKAVNVLQARGASSEQLRHALGVLKRWSGAGPATRGLMARAAASLGPVSKAITPAPRPSASSGASVTVDGRRIQPQRRADGTLVFRT
ncbi:MAG: hypothetical protein ACHQ0J_10510 [Candidatus Dormibacterales bacterium]